MLISCDISSLVIDYLYSQARGQNAAVACFYFDFAAENEQSLVGILGSLLKQLVFGLEEIPAEILEAYKDRKHAIGEQGPQISNILQMLQTTLARKRTFICIDCIDECTMKHRAKFLDSLGQLHKLSPRTRIFVTGRPHLLPEIRMGLNGRVTSMPINPKSDDIITYLHSRLAMDPTPDAMDSALKVDILKNIPSDVSGMYVEATPFRKLLQVIH